MVIGLIFLKGIRVFIVLKGIGDLVGGQYFIGYFLGQAIYAPNKIGLFKQKRALPPYLAGII
ncbi:hypothetical protein D3C87_2090810 [compost metagenome]